MAGITHEWNGTVLTITSDSGSSSCDLKGAIGDTGIRGPQGPKGEKGNGIDSVNGKIGDVVLTYEDVGALPNTYVAPVTSVNTKTGAVQLTYSDVGAAAANHTHTAADVGALAAGGTAADSSKLGGKASSAYTQSVDGVIPNSAGNVPLNIVSGERYYNSYTAGGTGDVDYITDTFAMVPIGTDKNPDLFAALGSAGSYAYIKTSFYNTQTSTSRRYQVAYSYNSIVQRKAWRTYTSSGWQRWNTDAQFSDVPRFNLLDNSNFANPIIQAGLNGKHGRTAYLCDRWNAYSITGEQKNGYIKLTGSVASSRITQNLDGVAGKTVTVAAKVTGSGRVYVGVYYTVNGTSSSITKAVNAPNGIISARGTIPSNAESIGFRIYPDNSGENLSANVFWAALYEGEYTDDNLPPYVPKGYAAELAECDLYYRPLGDNVMSVIGMTSSDGGVVLLKSIRPMRDGSLPTVINDGPLYVRVNGVDYTLTDVRILKSDKSGVEMLANASGAPSKQTATIHGSALLALSRDL